MRDNWTDFEKYVFTRLEENKTEHAEIKTKVAVLEERVRPRARNTIRWRIGIGALLFSFAAAIKQLWN